MDPMELRVSSPTAGGLSPSDCVSDPDEKEISDEDDDDRNHKHRRRETPSQSLERDAVEQVVIRPYRKRNKPLENGLPYRENESAKFEKRRPGLATFSRAPNRVNQSFSSQLGSSRGRGRESGSWSQSDPRFSSVDIASQMFPQASVHPSLFGGRVLPNVSNSQSASRSAFGLIPGVPNGSLDTIHSRGLQGMLGSSMGPLNIGIPRQRCRDFEERGFCLRGDMCPMEHGVNRIVVEDVQSLSQFNLPVSIPSSHLLGAAALPSVSGPSSSLMNSKSLHNKSNKPGMADDGYNMNDVFSSSSCAGGADFYDPDQPLWTNDCPETSTALLGLNSSKHDQPKRLLDIESSDRHRVRLFDGTDNKHQMRSSAAAVGSQSTSSSAGGIIGTSKSEMKEKIVAPISSSNNMENEAKEDQKPLTNLQGSLKIQGDIGHNIRKLSQKALRTLFINGIPQKDNKREALLSHFRKFGDVIDIYIPFNSERAFVQFSRREDAEAALKAPDAVMGNRFIKLWWANRDSIPDDRMSSASSVSVTPHGLAAVSVPTPPPVAHKRKDDVQPAAPKISVSNASVASALASDHPKPVVASSPKAPPPLHKKLESLELLKEELRKKQELLDQKRNDFRRQLNKLGKQATGLKGEVVSEQIAKRQKTGIVADVATTASPMSSDFGTVVASPQAEMVTEKNKFVENVVHQSCKPNAVVALHEPASLKQSIRPLAPAGPYGMNRFKLDNRPTAFKIIPPLPTGLDNVAVLKNHFSSFGELSAVELEDVESSDSVASRNCSARISFTTRSSAEMAFASGKCWQGCNLQFMWLASGNTKHDNGGREDASAASNLPARQVAPIDSPKVDDTRNAKSELLVRKDSCGECMERDEDLHSSSSAMSHD
ncbi:zinc finger CCCH domain-containing protein 41-like [Actinidia eriantha]|uniref:zinc finger CCCH domain-containing protein 41-like n=1 Tax=Actinidia eriantha TaxID=165200 RepID=UPI00258A2D09|nr:zinc finger CCCH domain-containing protein 41-like [Actinidia eriantha]XP_057481114.1 zinc finger CCCH domain-containing protein 41-like [Actinidia eriantha]XP_057481115.1 zinc finger CCCH domain-containing protein 41-like [Actinidia eriantha]